MIGSPRNKAISDFGSFVEDFEAIHESLDDGSFPMFGYFLVIEFFEEQFVPNESFGECLIALFWEWQCKVVVM